MHHHSVTAPKKKNAKASQSKHFLSDLLKNDSRIELAARHVEVIAQFKTKKDGQEYIVMVKVYEGLGTPGSELLTLSCARTPGGPEAEFRFDEKFPVSIKFRSQSDEERAAYVAEQVKRHGGWDKLFEIVCSVFPEFSV